METVGFNILSVVLILPPVRNADPDPEHRLSPCLTEPWGEDIDSMFNYNSHSTLPPQAYIDDSHSQQQQDDQLHKQVCD